MKQAFKLGLVLMLAACGGAEEAPEATTEEAPPAAPAPAPTAGLIDPNSAPLEQLLTVPGLDSANAAAIVAGRPYANMVAVNEVIGGVDDAGRDGIYERLWYPLDLNSATEEEIMLIPRVGAELAEEFEEYRPYDSIERFRREIGKYVDSTEVARLEQYVTIR
jgi:DNA uptake protein ComE-like DNA-binding protein